MGTTTVVIRIAHECDNGTAVADPVANPGLVADCVALYDAEAALSGTTTLDWSETTAITSWEGVTATGTPRRVTALDLDDEDLDGTIPSALGALSALATLDLSGNDLTGQDTRRAR